MAGKFAGVGRAARWLALLGAMAASGGAFAAQEGGVPMPALSGAVEWLNSPPLTRESLRGKVVLVDFFARGWKVWEENLPATRELWGRYHASGFEVVSICLEPNALGLETLGLPWAVVPGAPALTRPLGIFGETTSYLLDAEGRVIARDLRGQDLAFAVRRALGK